MKKIFFFALLSTIIVTVQAQVGLKGGLNLSTWDGKDVSNETVRLAGLYFGVYGNVMIYHSISVQSEVVFSEEGIKQKGTSDGVRLNYLNLTELVRHNIPHSGFFIGTGPQLGMLLTARSKQNGVKKFIKDEFKLGNFSWAFATGYDLKCGLGFYARYNLGLSNISAKLNTEIKQSSLQAGLRYNIRTKAK